MTATKDGMKIELTPIFCTVEIEPSIIDDFLRRENARFDRTRIGHNLCSFFLVTKDFEMPGYLERRSGNADVAEITVPVSPFESSAIGKTVDEIRVEFRATYSFKPFTKATLIIMDERTARDRSTCLLVSVGFEPTTARCEFGLAAEVLCGPESYTSSLNEGIDPEKTRDPEDENGILYTEETWPMTPESWALN